MMLKRATGVRSRNAGEIASKQLLLTGIFASSAILSVIPLIWFMAASVKRYLVIFPIYFDGACDVSSRDLSKEGDRPLGRRDGGMLIRVSELFKRI